MVCSVNGDVFSTFNGVCRRTSVWAHRMMHECITCVANPRNGQRREVMRRRLSMAWARESGPGINTFLSMSAIP